MGHPGQRGLSQRIPSGGLHEDSEGLGCEAGVYIPGGVGGGGDVGYPVKGSPLEVRVHVASGKESVFDCSISPGGEQLLSACQIGNEV